MPGSSTYKPVGSDVEVTISTLAMKRIGRAHVHEFIKLLGELMEMVGAVTAYVGKSGGGIAVEMWNPDGWSYNIKLPRDP